jgi:hypothetical protein
MSAKIIPFIPIEQAGKDKAVQTELSKYVQAAWSFAYTILWQEQQFPKNEIDLARQHIQHYFECATNKKIAFTAFCERILLTNRFLSADRSRFVPLPSIWLNRNYEHGFAGTRSWFQKIQLKRQDVPGYLQHISTIAEQYRQYALKPSAKVFNTCRKKLLELKAYGLLQYFYNSIIHLNYINQ